MCTEYERELDNLMSSSLSESQTPQQGGFSMVSDLTSSQREDINLNKEFSSEIKEESSPRLNVGELLSGVSSKIIEEDNKVYSVKVIRDICLGDIHRVCCKKRAGGKNTFCIKIDCDIEHRNEGASPVNLHLDSIVIERLKNVAFTSPLGLVKNVSRAVLKE